MSKNPLAEIGWTAHCVSTLQGEMAQAFPEYGRVWNNAAIFRLLAPLPEKAFQQGKERAMASKHPKTRHPSDADLRHDPGIGRSKGVDRKDPEIGGENTFEGDVLNDTTPQGGVDPRQRGRENK